MADGMGEQSGRCASRDEADVREVGWKKTAQTYQSIPVRSEP